MPTTYNKDYYETHKERILKANTNWRERNREYYLSYLKEYGKKYREEHKESEKVRKAAWYQANKERINKKHKEYLENNPVVREKHREACKKYYSDHREELALKRKQKELLGV